MDKKSISLRYWLQGREYFQALEAFEYASKFHTGTRKDGKTPEFSHQIEIALFLRTIINHLEHPQETLTTVFLHDTPEDYDVGFEEISARFGAKISKATMLLTKKHRGNKLEADAYYKGIASDAISSIVKGGDRIHNIQTMVDVFTLEKQKAYIEETENLVLPMLKSARRTFPRQEAAYENVKFILQNQLTLIKAIHKAKE